MFLRGIPHLCFDMRRPPKVKHAAAAARLASGAGFGSPDFDRINKVAPLPQSVHFKPVLKDAKGSNSEKYGLEIFEDDDDDDYMLQLADNSMPTKDKDASEKVTLSKADIHYLEHQNDILFSQGGFPVENSFNL